MDLELSKEARADLNPAPASSRRSICFLRISDENEDPKKSLASQGGHEYGLRFTYARKMAGRGCTSSQI
jgi:hypothetical protein